MELKHKVFTKRNSISQEMVCLFIFYCPTSLGIYLGTVNQTTPRSYVTTVRKVNI